MLANGRDQYVAMLEALFVAHWHPSDAFLSSDSLWLHLTEARLEKGDLAGAKEAASAVVTISSVVAMRIDKRFDAITSSDPSHFDIDVAFARDLAASRAAAAAAPDKLEGINQTATDLIITGKPADALAMLDKAIAESHLTEGKSQPFSDYADQINWTENNRAIALRNLGRIDESLEQLAKAATKSENGSPNVSQSINLAEAYNAAGRPKDALEAVGDIGTPSPYGRMALEYARACAHAQLHDDAGLGKSFEYIKAHVADAPAVYTDASICANDLDGAARAYIAAIEDPLQRTTALYYFQNFVRPTQREPMAAENYRRLLLVRDRADVRAVIEKYGRIVSLPFMDIGSE